MRLERERIAVLVVGTHFHALGPRHQLVDSRDRKAAFLDVRLASRFDNLRIDQHHERIAPLGDVDHDHLLVHVDLGRRQSNARRAVHGFGHVGDQLFECFIENGNGRSQLVESCVGVAEDVQHRHLRTNLFAN